MTIQERITKVNEKLNIVFEMSTLGDIPHIQRELRAISDEVDNLEEGYKDLEAKQ